jgi:predicted transcriptional regulator
VERLLTPAELEIMAVLWEAPGTVNDVMAALPDGRAYTTVATLLRILEQKGFATTRKDARRHVFTPAITREDYERTSVRDLVARLFRGDAGALARRLVEPLDDDERAEIKKLLEDE